MNSLLKKIIANPQKYLTEEQVSTMLSTYKKQEKENSPVPQVSKKNYIFTDGSCFKNGMKGCKGGYGVFFGDNDSRNMSQKIETKKVTNNVAELAAIYECVKILDNQKYTIVSDSMYSINCVTKWYKNWKKSNWKTAKGTDVANKELVVGITEELEKKNITFIHVNSHQKEPENKDSNEYFMWYGNHMADVLATSCNT